MTLNNTQSGPNNATEYQVSGLPFVTSSIATTTPQRIDFPKVTKSFQVRNLSTNTNLHIGFTQNGTTGSNRYTIPGASAEHFTVRTKVIWLMAESTTVNYTLFSEQTMIDQRHMPTLTSSLTTGDLGGLGWPGVG